MADIKQQVPTNFLFDLEQNCFTLKKNYSDNSKKIESVILNKKSGYACNFYDKIIIFFPNIRDTIYDLTIDFQDMGHSGVNIIEFLSLLGSMDIINSLKIINSSPYQFDDIYPGLVDLYTKTNNIKIDYYGKVKYDNFCVEQCYNSYFTKNDNDPDIIKGLIEKLNSDLEDLTFLKNMIQFESLNGKLSKIKEKWSEHESSWPPLNLQSKEQIINCHVTKLSSMVNQKFDLSPIILEVTGVMGDFDDIIKFCLIHPTISCLRICHSICSIRVVDYFYDVETIDRDGDPIIYDSLLGDDKIKFLDLTTALRVDTGYTDKIDYVVGIPHYSPYTGQLNTVVAHNSKLFNILLEYIEILEEN